MKLPRMCFVSFAPQVHELLEEDLSKRSGGAGIQQIVLCRELSRHGVPVELVVPAFGCEQRRFTSDGIKVNAGILPPKGPKFVRAVQPMLSTFRALRSANAELYHVWGAFRGSGYVALYCLWKRIPFIFSVYNNRDVDGTAVRSLGPLDRFLYRLVLRRAAAIFAETEYELELLRRNFGREGILVRNLCPVSDDADAERERDLILWVGQFRNEKRPWMFVELAVRIPECRFVMIGGPHASNPDLFEEVQSRARELPNLTLTGQLPLRDTADHYRQALLLALSSTDEGFPNVMLEAWRTGTPTVSSFDPDGVVSRYDLGLYCEDFDSMEAAIRKLLGDNETRVSMGKRAIEYVKEHHDPDKIAARVIASIQALVHGGVQDRDAILGARDTKVGDG